VVKDRSLLKDKNVKNGIRMGWYGMNVIGWE
jgi:hypothetical protein